MLKIVMQSHRGAFKLNCSHTSARSFLVPVVSTAFVGHLGPDVLASVVLASSLFNVTGNSVIVGLSAGMETLCGQV